MFPDWMQYKELAIYNLYNALHRTNVINNHDPETWISIETLVIINPGTGNLRPPR